MMLFVLTAIPAAAQSNPALGQALLLDNTVDSQSLTGRFSLLRDPDHALSLFDVAFGPAAGRFEPVAQNLALGYTSDIGWIKLTLRAGPQEVAQAFYSLALLPIYLDRIDIYVPRVSHPRDEGDFVHVMRGDHVSDGRSARQNFVFAVPFTPIPDADMTIYLRIATTSTMALRGWVVTPTGLETLLLGRSAVTIGLIALTVNSALLSLIYWVSTRQRYFLNFSLLVLADGLYVAATSGVAAPLLRLLDAPVGDRLVAEAVMLVALANVVFVREQWETRRHFRGFDRFLRLVTVLTLLAMVATASGFYAYVAASTFLLVVLSVTMSIYAGLRLIQRHRKPGMIAAMTVAVIKLVSGSIVVTWTVGAAETTGFLENSYWIAVAVFTPMMALSLVQRGRYLDSRRRDRDSLRLARNAERKARQLVEIRTAELKDAKDLAEAALAAERQAQVEQLRFVDVVRHQYQTPLAVITNSAAALSKTLPPGDTGNDERLGRIKAAVSDLVQVLDVSLHRSRLEGAVAAARRTPVQPRDTVSAIVERCRVLHGDRVITLAFADGMADGDGSVQAPDSPEDLTVALDPDMLGIAMSNMIDNAVKFSAADRPVAVTCRLRPRQMEIEVLDEGIGIPEQEAADLGKRYFRASNAGAINGTGLGLHIVGSVARAHDGDFSLSNRQGGGAKAVLRLAF